ncbi:hypothetical protein CPB83DRAFT_882442 [Crepidotus variabilis]|uniref:Uncharacterized protein n=1 Tax=Crepidotus variabilis TaxID=179855 RepID=A0A9P6EJI4_9AGAR|nr:hypothetical protein CPB83DRAFT_882442 [Crepidotus variabilis]
MSLSDDTINPNLSRLTRLRVEEFLAIRVWMDLMEICGELQSGEFSVNTYSSTDRDALDNDIIRVHSTLQEMSLHTVYDGLSAAAVLAYFQFPSLKNLRISAEDEIDPTPPPPSIFESFASIRSLSIDRSWKSQAPYMVNLFRETINLEKLVIDYCPRSFSRVFEAMTLGSGLH